MMAKHAIFLNGPIGTGKTTLGRALADRLSAGFIDGDDFSDPDRPWYCSILQTSRSIIQDSVTVLATSNAVIIAYPLNCINWIYSRRKLADVGINTLFISLRASYAAIVNPQRGRIFSAEECDRILVMIAEGYGDRSFSDLVIETDKADFATTLMELERRTRQILAL